MALSLRNMPIEAATKAKAIANTMITKYASLAKVSPFFCCKARSASKEDASGACHGKRLDILGCVPFGYVFYLLRFVAQQKSWAC
jgi:hypothetical protein